MCNVDGTLNWNGMEWNSNTSVYRGALDARSAMHCVSYFIPCDFSSEAAAVRYRGISTGNGHHKTQRQGEKALFFFMYIPQYFTLFGSLYITFLFWGIGSYICRGLF